MRIFPDGKLIELKHLGQVISISTIALSKRSQYQASLSQAYNSQNLNSKPRRPAQKISRFIHGFGMSVARFCGLKFSSLIQQNVCQLVSIRQTKVEECLQPCSLNQTCHDLLPVARFMVLGKSPNGEQKQKDPTFFSGRVFFMFCPGLTSRYGNVADDQRMKFVRRFFSISGGTTLPQPFSTSFISQAIFLPSTRMIWTPSSSCTASPGRMP